jgi:hypothetical protein
MEDDLEAPLAVFPGNEGKTPPEFLSTGDRDRTTWKVNTLDNAVMVRKTCL